MNTAITTNTFQPNTNGLELSPITINEDYRKKWNIHQRDFFLLTMNGVPLRDTLYRKGGMFGNKDLQKDYFVILKHTEAFYEDDITNIVSDKSHLQSTSVIINKFGNEKVNFGNFRHPYLLGGVIYALDSKIYNIETGYCYGGASSSIQSEGFIFLDNKYHNVHDQRGVWKIDKRLGTYEIFK